ncbi:DUF3954 domain-containing protein [Bacillaceae bacterium SIJ1]|uniref:DUF3954 domain-containing protein n=1 Tax=Litoribacterium kuwaitense TaxID=1398745 RepID=UPI0013ECF2EC|nr:DUF3954 domain-containing protein [Litoribacterium kuwaitense]NGP45990.1 DUF3954 domain-containing protein [Litoribacterium kuwaitense]
MKKIPVDIESMKAEIDVSENAVYVVCDGDVECYVAPSTGYGRHEVGWKKGTVTTVDCRETRVRQ